MTELLTTITAMAIHPANSSPVFGEMTTRITMTDEAAGIFFELTQDDKTISVTVEELRAMWFHASSVQQEQIQARVNQLTGKEKTND